MFDKNGYRIQPTPEFRLDDPRSSVPKCWITLGTREIELLQGQTVVGRHDSCHVVLDDPLASRRHARLELRPSGHLLVEDLGSVNGVLVNGQRAEKPRVLADGDVVRLGNQELTVHLTAASLEARRQARVGAETLTNAQSRSSAPPSLSSISSAPPSGEEESTIIREGDALGTLTTVANKVLAMGRAAEAERILKTSLLELLRRAEEGHVPDPKTLELAATYSLRLAEALSRVDWIDYTFRLFTVSERILPAAAVEKLYELVRSLEGVDLAAMRRYAAHMTRHARSLGPSELFLLRRIDGLTKLASL